MKQKKPTRKEQQFWHQKFLYLLPPDIVVGKMLSYRIFDDKYYSVRTLKQFCSMLEWLKENRKYVPEYEIRFHGNCFTVNVPNNIFEIMFAGSKFKGVTTSINGKIVVLTQDDLKSLKEKM